MNFIKSYAFLFQMISVLVLLCLLLFTFIKARRSALLNTVVTALFLLLVWTVFQMIDINAKTYNLMLFAVRIKFIPICFIGFVWLVFAIQYAGYKLKEHKLLVACLILPCVLSYIMVFTNGYHHLFYRIFGLSGKYKGIFFWIMSLTTYIYVLTGAIIMVRVSISNKNVSKRVTTLLIAAIIVPIIPNVLFNTGVMDLGFDVAPMSFTFSALLYFTAIYRYKFLNIVPIALNKIFDNVGEAIVLLDNNDNIIKYNQAFKDIMSLTEKRQHKIIDDQKYVSVIDLFKEFFKQITARNNINFSHELTMPFLEGKFYRINIKPLTDKKGNSLGKLIFLNDITEYKNLLNQLNEKKYQLENSNLKLNEANIKLKGYLSTVEELAVARERDRISTELHDSLGHSMTQIISLIKISQITYDKNCDEAKSHIQQASEIAAESFNQLERTISGAIPANLEEGILTCLKKLIESSKHPDLNIVLKVEGEEFLKYLEYNEVIYRICQEGITNSLKHGKAHNIYICIKADEYKILVSLSDDGVGCKKLDNGFGITGLTKRVSSINGTIFFKPGKKHGFIIEAQLITGR